MQEELTDEGKRADAFLGWAESLCGTQPRFIRFDGTRITLVVFDDEPDPGWRVALTYGLSTTAGEVGNELLLMVNSHSDAWLEALVQAADERQEWSGELEPGMTGDWPEPIAPDSAMNGFVLWEPFALPEDVAGVVHLPGRHVVVLQVVAVHASELAWLRSFPPEGRRKAVVDLLQPLGESMYDVGRPPAR